eukprot:TRINITY_DN9454_c0_g1_i1.p1 TRINITY_DN9454_c0_g1~~TRINITY_DN9454_c0_g1_i1.p1  ORF type:complete len:527 (-),score=132.31 TRINITY_DN9454_c0_g1_i1:451-2031(-)
MQVNSLDKICKELEHRLAEHEATIDSLQQELACKSDLVEHKDLSLSVARNTSNRLIQEKEEIIDFAHQEQVIKDQLILELQLVMSDIAQKLQTMEDEISRLRKENDGYSTQMAAWKAVEEQWKMFELRSLEEIDSREKEILICRERLHHLEMRLTEALREEEALKSNFHGKQIEYDSLIRELSAKLESTSILNHELTNAKSALEIELDNLKCKEDTFKQQIAQGIQRLDEITSISTLDKERLQVLEVELSKRTEEIDFYHAKVSSLEGQLAENSKLFDQKNIIEQELRLTLNQLGNRLEEESQSRNQIQSRVMTLSEEKQASDKFVLQLQKQLQESQEKYESDRNRMMTVYENLRQEANVVPELQSQLTETQELVERLELVNQQLREAYNQAIRTQEALQRDATSIEAEKNALRLELEQLSSTKVPIASTNLNSNRLGQEYLELKRQHEATLVEMENLGVLMHQFKQQSDQKIKALQSACIQLQQENIALVTHVRTVLENHPDVVQTNADFADLWSSVSEEDEAAI